MGAVQGDTVKIHYRGTFDNGEEFDSSLGRQPLEFKIGAQSVIPGFEQGVMGMEPGDKKTVRIPCDQAYGPHSDKMIMAMPRSQFPPDLKLIVGGQLQMQTNTGQQVVVTIKEVGDQDVTLDANHPMAGKDLNFDLELVAINQAV